MFFEYPGFDDEWMTGPPLPTRIEIAALVENPVGGGVYLFGGKSSNEDFLDTIFHLPTPDGVWTELQNRKLNFGRRGFVAFFVPDAIATCS